MTPPVYHEHYVMQQIKQIVYLLLALKDKGLEVL